MDWNSDRSLKLRMGAALALVAVMPLCFVLTLSGAFNAVVVPLADLLLAADLARLHVDPVPVFGLTLLGMALSYGVGDRVALRSVGATRVESDARPDLHARVGRLAATADLPAPDVAVVHSGVPNAFATGRSPDSATVAVSEGLLDTLDDDELDAVLAHELAHVKNRDATVMTVAYLLPTVTFYVAKVAYVVLVHGGRAMLHLDLDDSDDARGVAVVVVLFVVTTLVTLTVSAIFWAASMLLFRILSRYREYAADRGAAAITGEPAALAAALSTIDEEMTAIPDRDLRDLDGGVEALYVSPLDVPMFTDDDPALISQDVFPETHPPTADRVERLQSMSRDLETQSTGGDLEIEPTSADLET